MIIIILKFIFSGHGWYNLALILVQNRSMALSISGCSWMTQSRPNSSIGRLDLGLQLEQQKG